MILAKPDPEIEDRFSVVKRQVSYGVLQSVAVQDW